MSVVTLLINPIRLYLTISKREHLAKYKTFIDAFVFDLQRFPPGGTPKLILVGLSGRQGNVLQTRFLWCWVANGNI